MTASPSDHRHAPQEALAQGPLDALAPDTDRPQAGRRWSLRLFIRIVVLAVAVQLLLPQVVGARQLVDVLVRLHAWLLVAVLGLEAASLAAYAELVRWVLDREGAPTSRRAALAAVLTGTAFGKVLPGGTVAALPVTVRFLQRTGLDPAVAASGLVASGVVSSLVLVALLPVASGLALLAGHGDAVALTTSGIATGVAALVAGVVWLWFRDPLLGRRIGDAARAAVPSRRLQAWLHFDAVALGLERAAAALRPVVQGGRALAAAGGLAASKWLLDFGVFAALAVAGTRGAPLAGIGLAYVLGQLSATVPLTPGGVGVVEATMTAALVAQHIPAGQAAAVVLAWRVVSHWLPIVVGLSTYLLSRRAIVRLLSD